MNNKYRSKRNGKVRHKRGGYGGSVKRSSTGTESGGGFGILVIVVFLIIILF